jgi:hypothetical protein
MTLGMAVVIVMGVPPPPTGNLHMNTFYHTMELTLKYYKDFPFSIVFQFLQRMWMWCQCIYSIIYSTSQHK